MKILLFFFCLFFLNASSQEYKDQLHLELSYENTYYGEWVLHFTGYNLKDFIEIETEYGVFQVDQPKTFECYTFSGLGYFISDSSNFYYRSSGSLQIFIKPECCWFKVRITKGSELSDWKLLMQPVIEGGCNTIYIPNVFSGTFQAFPAEGTYTMEIFNRWGIRLSDEPVWIWEDPGVYVYRIVFENRVYMGTVTCIK